MKMQTETKSEIFRTHDIILASFLYCSGIQLISIDRQDPRRCIFLFERPSSLLLSEWQRGTANVNLLAFHNAYSVLKAQVFNRDSHEGQK